MLCEAAHHARRSTHPLHPHFARVCARRGYKAAVVAVAHRLQARVRRGELINAGRLFQRANLYLTAVFCALAVDSMLALPTTLNPTG